jgi:hypothetical protein
MEALLQRIDPAWVAVGIARLGARPINLGLVADSIAVNARGVYWGVMPGW